MNTVLMKLTFLQNLISQNGLHLTMNHDYDQRLTGGGALILGGSGDIGSAFSSVLREHFDFIWLTCTRQQERDGDQQERRKWVEYSYPNNTAKLEKTLAEYGENLSLFINCIGVYSNEDSILDVAHTRHLIDVNFHSLQFALGLIKKFSIRDIDVINVSSIASHSGSSSEFSYSSSKELVDRLMANLRFDVSFKNSRILNVRPGAIKSKMTANRTNSEHFIEPLDLASLALDTLYRGDSVKIPVLDVYRSR